MHVVFQKSVINELILWSHKWSSSHPVTSWNVCICRACDGHVGEHAIQPPLLPHPCVRSFHTGPSLAGRRIPFICGRLCPLCLCRVMGGHVWERGGRDPWENSCWEARLPSTAWPREQPAAWTPLHRSFTPSLKLPPWGPHPPFSSGSLPVQPLLTVMPSILFHSWSNIVPKLKKALENAGLVRLKCWLVKKPMRVEVGHWVTIANCYRIYICTAMSEMDCCRSEEKPNASYESQAERDTS